MTSRIQTIRVQEDVGSRVHATGFLNGQVAVPIETSFGRIFMSLQVLDRKQYSIFTSIVANHILLVCDIDTVFFNSGSAGTDGRQLPSFIVVRTVVGTSSQDDFRVLHQTE